PISPPAPYTTLFRSIRELVNDYQAHLPEEEQADAPAEPVVSAFIPVTRGLNDLATLLPDRFPEARIQVVENARAVSVTATPTARSEEHTSELQSREN